MLFTVTYCVCRANGLPLAYRKAMTPKETLNTTTMKLGIETGSVVNHMMANNSTSPVVGEGATILMWTDRHAYTVRSISKNGKTVVMEECDAKRTDSNGMSECQEYDFSEHTGNMVTVNLLRGNWRRVAANYEFTDAYFKAAKGLTWATGRKELDASCTDEDGHLIAHPEYTELKKKYTKVSILWGERQQYHGFSF